MNQDSDEELVLKVQSGDIIAFEQLVVRYQKRLFYFVFRIVRSESDAQELVQDAFFKLYTHIASVNTQMKFSTYLFAIAKNAAFSFLRSKRINSVSIDEIAELETDAKIMENMITDEEAILTKRAMASLDEKYRRPLDLYYFSELSYEQIARKEHIPLNTVRTRLSRAKNELKKILTTYETD
jgi:RNA polymerase sigma-70 factor, ECF subfamily